MVLREITEDMVVGVIEHPEQTGASFGSRLLARRMLDDRALEVVFVREQSRVVVVTMYWVGED